MFAEQQQEGNRTPEVLHRSGLYPPRTKVLTHNFKNVHDLNEHQTTITIICIGCAWT
jgi:formate hydrogenlyase subunit 6/NADH:ubiquinone oxidoreductase subunit I